MSVLNYVPPTCELAARLTSESTVFAKYFHPVWSAMVSALLACHGGLPLKRAK
jgi:hypothetical protein